MGYEEDYAQAQHDAALRDAFRKQPTADELAGRASLNETIKRNKAAAADAAKAQEKAAAGRAAAKKAADDEAALRLRTELRRAYAGSDSEFERAFPSLLATYRERETLANVTQRRAELRRQIQKWA